jgi:hypothetical protein
LSVIKEDFKETPSSEKEAMQQIDDDIEEAVSEYYASVKTEMLNRYSKLISVQKEAGKYFFMGQWLDQEEISNLYRFMKRKDRSLIFYLACLTVILLFLDLFMVWSLFPPEQRTQIFSFISGLIN